MPNIADNYSPYLDYRKIKAGTEVKIIGFAFPEDMLNTSEKEYLIIGRTHAVTKVTHCDMTNKHACKNCPTNGHSPEVRIDHEDQIDMVICVCRLADPKTEREYKMPKEE